MILYDETEEALLDSLVMQRLRGIRQLALTEYVYPGAKHSRFEHSIGTMEVASRIATQIGLKGKTLRIVRLAALLHDIGHGPFSHVSEKCLEKYSDIANKPDQLEIHEIITANIIENDPNISGIIRGAKIDPHDVAVLIAHGENRTLLSDIVSGPVDADKLDYLLRDSYYAGVKYGIYDLERIVSESYIVGEKRENLGFYSGAMWAIEQLILARHHMFTQVYQHRVRLITDAMIVRGLTLAAEEDPHIKRLFAYNDSVEFRNGWLSLDDEEIVRRILTYDSKLPESPAKRIFSLLENRKLFKQVARIEATTDLPVKKRDALAKLDEAGAQAIEREVAGSLGLKEWEVIVNIVDMNRPGSRSQTMTINAGTIFIKDKRRRDPWDFGEHPDALEISPKYRKCVDVYLHIRGDTPEQQQSFRKGAAKVAKRALGHVDMKAGAQ